MKQRFINGVGMGAFLPDRVGSVGLLPVPAPTVAIPNDGESEEEAIGVG